MKHIFFLASPKADKSSISAIIRINGQRFKKGTGVSVETKYWDNDRQRASVNKRYPDGAKINHELGKLEIAINNVIAKISVSDDNLAQVDFWLMVSCEGTGGSFIAKRSTSYIFTDYFENVFIKRFNGTKSDTRIQRFHVILAKLRDFEVSSEHRYAFDEINIEYYRNLQNYMNNLGHSANYFGTVIRIIKQVMKESQLIDKLHDNKEFMSSAFKAITQDVDAVYLTTDELKKIHDTPIDHDFVAEMYPLATKVAAQSIIRSYNIVKNRFLFGAYTGLRMSDFNKIDNNNISKGFITVITEKTDQRVVIPIHPIVKDILDSGFDLSESLSDAKTRLYIKHICKYVKIDEVVEVRESIGGRITINRYPKCDLVGTHTARRSFATNAYKAGIPTISIMKITGHAKESTFMKYIRISQEENAEILAQHSFFK